MKVETKFASLFIILVVLVVLPFTILERRAVSLEQWAIITGLLTIGTLAFIVVSKRITHSISQLLHQVSSFLQGDLTQRVKSKSKDEIGKLANAFNQMIETVHADKKELGQLTKKLSTSTQQLKKRISELSALNRATKTLNSTLGLEKKYNLIVDKAISIVNAEKSVFILTDRQENELDIKCTQGENIRPGLHRELARWVTRNNEPILLNGKSSDLQFKGLLEENDAGAVMCAPLKTKNGPLGSISVERSTSQEGFVKSDLELFSTFSNEVALALENALLADKLIESRELDSFNRITSVVIHDLKGSISGLSILLSNTEQNYDNPEFRADLTAIIADTVKKIEDLVARLTSRPHLLELKSEFIKLIIERVIDKLDLRELEGIQLSEEYEELPDLMVDKKNMERVFENLIVNALEAMPEGGKLRIASWKEGGTPTAVIEITDTGHGMTEEFINNGLFKPFRTTKAKGLGLGLFSSREIIFLHGGKTEVKSEVGEGTTFMVKLPIFTMDGRLKAIREI